MPGPIHKRARARSQPDTNGHAFREGIHTLYSDISGDILHNNSNKGHSL